MYLRTLCIDHLFFRLEILNYLLLKNRFYARRKKIKIYSLNIDPSHCLMNFSSKAIMMRYESILVFIVTLVPVCLFGICVVALSCCRSEYLHHEHLDQKKDNKDDNDQSFYIQCGYGSPYQGCKV